MRLIDADALQKVFIEECAGECSNCIYNKSWVRTEDGIVGEWQGCELIDNAPTTECPKQITINCDTEEEKQKLLSALRNARLTICEETNND